MQDANLRMGGATFVTTKAGLSGITGAATTFSTTAAIVYAINGKAYSKAAVSGGATPTTDSITGVAFVPLAANQGCAFLFHVNAAGTIGVAQGGVQALDKSGAFVVPPQFADVPDTVAPFGYVIVKDGSTGGAWTFGTSNWNATGITVSVQDILSTPGRAQVS
jgi:hypothetical protein